jgi:hypothetical protein
MALFLRMDSRDPIHASSLVSNTQSLGQAQSKLFIPQTYLDNIKIVPISLKVKPNRRNLPIQPLIQNHSDPSDVMVYVKCDLFVSVFRV